MVKDMIEVDLQTNREWLDGDLEYRLQTRTIYPSMLDRGEGCLVWDVEGKEYLDLMSSQICLSLGHSHPELIAAVARQSEMLMQTGLTFGTP